MRKRKYSYEEVRDYIRKRNYELLTRKYKNNKQNLILMCPQGHLLEVRFDEFKNGNKRCHCENKRTKLSKDYILEYIYKYLNSRVINFRINKGMWYLTIICNKRHIYETMWENIKDGCRCPHCHGNFKFKYKNLKTIIEKEGYILLTEEKDYSNLQTYITIQCNNSHMYTTKAYVFKQGNRCPHCNGNGRHSYEYVNRYIEENGYFLLDDKYINNSTKLSIKCSKNHIFYMSFNNFKEGNRCPICNHTSGENKIAIFFENNDIKFVEQYRFEDCKFYKTLPFDFYLPDYNILIEYDGIQHYKIVKHFGGFDGFINTKIRDTIKNEYCKRNNIKLIRIPYWEFDNIEDILKCELNLI